MFYSHLHQTFRPSTKGRIDSQEVVLLKPLTYISSGEAVKETVDFPCRPEDLVVITTIWIFGSFALKEEGGRRASGVSILIGTMG
jgi:peptidyl-tRNA hydrolase